MKKTNIIYWIFTGLFAAFMLFTSVGDIMVSKEAVDFMTLLGYPKYILPFLGVAKTLGVIAILVQGNYPRIKEWAYAGLFFDLIGATYSNLSAFPINAQFSFMLLPFILGIGSYIYYHKKRKAANMQPVF